MHVFISSSNRDTISKLRRQSLALGRQWRALYGDAYRPHIENAEATAQACKERLAELREADQLSAKRELLGLTNLEAARLRMLRA